MRRYGRMTREKSAQMHAAKARKRMASPMPDYPTAVDYDAPVESWRIHNFVTGKIHDLVLFPSRRRSNTFLVKVNGTVWTKSMGYDKIMRQTVKSLACHSQN